MLLYHGALGWGRLSECDTEAPERDCPKLWSDKILQRLRQEFIISNYKFLYLAILRARDHGEIYKSSQDPERQSGLLLLGSMLNKVHSFLIWTPLSKLVELKNFEETMNLPQGELVLMETTNQPNKESQELTWLFHQTKKTRLILSYKDMSEEIVEPVLNTLAGMSLMMKAHGFLSTMQRMSHPFWLALLVPFKIPNTIWI